MKGWEFEDFSHALASVVNELRKEVSAIGEKLIKHFCPPLSRKEIKGDFFRGDTKRFTPCPFYYSQLPTKTNGAQKKGCSCLPSFNKDNCAWRKASAFVTSVRANS